MTSDNRKRAYSYMVGVVRNWVNWVPPIDSDEKLAEALDVPVNDLTSLKEGLSNPSEKLVAAFKKLVCPLVSESEVDSYLVTPFTKGTK